MVAALIAFFSLISFISHPRAGYVDPANFNAFSCPADEVLHVYSKGNNYVKLSCSPITTCAKSIGCKPALCNEPKSFVSGILKLSDDSILTECCQLDGEDSSRVQEQCVGYSVTSNGNTYSSGQVLQGAEMIGHSEAAYGPGAAGQPQPIARLFKPLRQPDSPLLIKNVKRDKDKYKLSACAVKCADVRQPNAAVLPTTPITDDVVHCDNCELTSPRGLRPTNSISDARKPANLPAIVQVGSKGVEIYGGTFVPLRGDALMAVLANRPSIGTYTNAKGTNQVKVSCSKCNLPLDPIPGPTFTGNVRALAGGCFSEDVQVRSNAGYKRMDQLGVGEQVMVGSAQYDEVDLFLHKSATAVADFLILRTQSNRSITITGNHLIPLFPCNADPLVPVEANRFLFASKATTRHCLMVIGSTESHGRLEKIVSIEKVIKRGVYAPVTSQGTLLVNDILVSCYSTLEDQMLQWLFHRTAKFVAYLFLRLFGTGQLTYLDGLLKLSDWTASNLLA